MLIPSAINPIYFFKIDEPVFWQQNFYEVDRGNYVRNFKQGIVFRIYFQADGVATAAIKRCSDGSTALALPAPVNITGNYYYVDVAALALALKQKYYFTITKGAEVVYSEQFQLRPVTSFTVRTQPVVAYSNKRLYQGIQPNTEISTYWPIQFWQTKNPQQFEDIEILPGEFTRLRNELNNETMMETDYLPPYMHRSIQLSLAMDVIKIQSVEQIQRSEYAYDFTNRHYQLSKGKVTLTERKSIVRNVI